MKLFTNEGHLTKAGLGALINGSLNELQSLETAEHLSFCDDCLTTYTALLADCKLMEPSSPLQPGIRLKMFKKSSKSLLRQYRTAAAALFVALALWAGMVFAAPPISPGQSQRKPQTQAAFAVSSWFNQAANSVDSSLSFFVSRLFQKPPATEEEEKEKEGKEKEEKDSDSKSKTS